MRQSNVGGVSVLSRSFNRLGCLLTFVSKRKLTYVCTSVNERGGMVERRFKED